METAQQVIGELTGQRFPQNYSILQRTLQILRMCLSRYVLMFFPSGVSIRSQKSLGGALIAIQISPLSHLKFVTTPGG